MPSKSPSEQRLKGRIGGFGSRRGPGGVREGGFSREWETETEWEWEWESKVNARVSVSGSGEGYVLLRMRWSLYK